MRVLNIGVPPLPGAFTPLAKGKGGEGFLRSRNRNTRTTKVVVLGFCYLGSARERTCAPVDGMGCFLVMV